MQDPTVIRLDIEYLGRRLEVEADEARKHKLERLRAAQYETLTKALTERWKATPEQPGSRITSGDR
jgi:hypothetical protein